MAVLETLLTINWIFLNVLMFIMLVILLIGLILGLYLLMITITSSD